MLFAGAEVDGRRVDVRVTGMTVSAVSPRLRPLPDEDVVAAGGGALLPGLHDHHLHLLAMAAAAESVPCGPDDVAGRAQLGELLRAASKKLPAGRWLRATGYHDSVAGPLDRHALDALLPDRPLRVQHRGGALWVLNSAALGIVGPRLDGTADVERTPDGTPTGRLWRYDARLRAIVGGEPPQLAAVGRRLAELGITGVTDATPDLDDGGQRLIVAAVADGSLPVRVVLLGGRAGGPLATTQAGTPDAHGPVVLGPWKLLLRDHDLPSLDELVGAVGRSHAAGRPVAVHCVSRESLLLALTAIEQAGAVSGDRIEHASVVPEPARDWIARLGLRVVTQPAFIADRGDDYLVDVAPDDRPLLYPYASLLAAGAQVAAASDAPFGELDPWRVIAAATSRLTRSGRTLVASERVPAATALAGYLAPPEDPGGASRRVEVGAIADLCLLRAPLATALGEPSAELVRLTMRSGALTWPSS